MSVRLTRLPYGLKVPVFPLTRPTLFFFVLTIQLLLLPFRKKNKKIFIPIDRKMFQKIDKKLLKNVRIAKLMLRIIFFTSLDVLNFIICMFSGTVDDS